MYTFPAGLDKSAHTKRPDTSRYPASQEREQVQPWVNRGAAGTRHGAMPVKSRRACRRSTPGRHHLVRKRWGSNLTADVAIVQVKLCILLRSILDPRDTLLIDHSPGEITTKNAVERKNAGLTAKKHGRRQTPGVANAAPAYSTARTRTHLASTPKYRYPLRC